MKRIAIYGRISSSKQADNFSIDTQLSMMRDYSLTEGYEVIELAEQGSAFIEGLSRSQLQKALELARQGQIDALMFFSPDRFTRDMADGVILRRELRNSGVKLLCYYPTPREITNDMEVLNILTDWQSQQYVEKLREATKRGVRAKADEGLFPQGNAPYGYRLTGKKKNTVIELVEEEAVVIKRIFDAYLYGRIGAAEIANTLNAEHIPSPGDELWTPRAVRKILKKTVYYGTFYAFTFKMKHIGSRVSYDRLPNEQGTPVPVPAIVTKSEWDMVQSLLSSRHIGRNEDNHYLMSSRLKCSCGMAMVGTRNRNGKTPKIYFYYRCHSEFSRKGHCGMPKWQRDPIDETVWKFSMELIDNPERVLLGYRALQIHEIESYDATTRQIQLLEAEIAEREEELASIVDQRTKAKSPTLQAILDQKSEEYAGIIDSLLQRLDLMKQQQDAEPLTDEAIDELVTEVRALGDVIEALHTIDETADFSAKRKLIDLLNLHGKIRIDEDNQKWVDITWGSKKYERLVCAPKTPNLRA